MAGSLSGQVSAIESSIALMGYMSDRLRFLQPSIRSLILGAASQAQFSELTFLSQCAKSMEKGETFAAAWRSALLDKSGVVGGECSDILISLTDNLGCTDLESQLSAIEYTKTLLNAKLEAARENEKKYSRLYRTLGVLAGLAIVIIII